MQLARQNVLLTFFLHAKVSEAYLTCKSCVGRPGGLKKTPPSEVGNLVTGKEDTLFGLPTQRGKDISRDTVRAKSSPLPTQSPSPSSHSCMRVQCAQRHSPARCH